VRFQSLKHDIGVTSGLRWVWNKSQDRKLEIRSAAQMSLCRHRWAFWALILSSMFLSANRCYKEWWALTSQCSHQYRSEIWVVWSVYSPFIDKVVPEKARCHRVTATVYLSPFASSSLPLVAAFAREIQIWERGCGLRDDTAFTAWSGITKDFNKNDVCRTKLYLKRKKTTKCQISM
jgi:hypothetical protein